MDRTLGHVLVAQVRDSDGACQALVDMIEIASNIPVMSGSDVVLQLKALYAAVDALKVAMPIVAEPVQGPLPRPEVPAVKQLELHLSSDVDLPKRHGAKIKQLGGSYSECRGGYTDKRFVTLPCTEEGRALADELLRCYPKADTLGKRDATIVVLRGGADFGRVQYVKNNSPERIAHALARYERHVNALIDEGREP